MAEGQCGALQVQRKYEPGAARDPSDDPPPHAARIIAPIFGDDLLYLRVSDFGGDGFAPDNFYRLRVRTRREPDKHEPSNVYMNTLTRSGQPTGINLSLARRNNVVPVHLCGVRPSDPCLEEQPQCNNGEDDDGDRVTDYPNDPGCTSPTDDREVDPERALPCSNGEDDDFDGLIDYPDDLDCVSAAWRNEGSPACPGGVDLRYIGRQQNLVEGSTGNTALYGGTCGGAAGRESVYALTLSYPGEVTLRLEADFEAAIYALWGCEPGAEEIGCGTGGQDLTLNFETPGVFIVVVDAIDAGGDFRLHVDRTPPPQPCEPNGEADAGQPRMGGAGGDGGSPGDGPAELAALVRR